MAIAVAQASINNANYNNTGSGTTVAITLTVAAGSTVVVWVTWDPTNSASCSVADPTNGTYTAGPINNDTGDSQAFQRFYKNNVAAGTITITATFGGNVTFRAIVAAEVTGSNQGVADGSSGQIQASPGTGADAITTGNMTNTGQPALVVACSINITGTSIPAAGTGMTSNASDATVLCRVASKRITSTGTTQTGTFTASEGTQNYITAGFIFDEGTTATVNVAKPKLRTPPFHGPAGLRGPRLISRRVLDLLPSSNMSGEGDGAAAGSGTMTGVGTLGGTGAGQAAGSAALGGAVGGTAAGSASGSGTLVGALQITVSKDTSGFTTTTGTTAAVTFTARAGDAFIVFVTWDSQTLGTSAVADNLNTGGTYNQLNVTNDSTDQQAFACFALNQLTAGGSCTVTATFNGPRQFRAIWVVQIPASVAGSDGVNGNVQRTPGTGTDALVSATFTNTVQPGTMIGLSMDITQGTIPSVGTGFSSLDSDATTGVRVESKTVSTISSTQQATFTPGANNPHITMGVIVDAAGSSSSMAGTAAGTSSGSGTLITNLITGTAAGQAAGSGTLSVPSSYVYPLKIGTSNRYLVDQNNKPFLLLGDAAWSLAVNLNMTDVATYLDDRKARGFNAVLVNLIEHQYTTSTAPANYNGDLPFTSLLSAGNYDFTTPNAAYWSHVDDVINAAAARGMVVFACAAYLGFNGGGEGWYTEMQANGTTRLSTYGTFIGNRYKNFPNIVWVAGGDYNPPDQTLTNAVEAAILAADTNHVHTGHQNSGTSAMTEWGGFSWLAFNDVYGYPGNSQFIYSMMQTEYSRSGAEPVFLIESTYEHSPFFTWSAALLRQQAYEAILNGGFGELVGNEYVWPFGAVGVGGSAQPWATNLNTQTANDQTRLGSLFSPRAWHTLAPDIAGTFLTVGAGTGSSRVSAALSSDGKLAAVYTPSGGFTLDMSKMSGSTYAQWYDPSTGTFSAVSGSPLANSGTHAFTTPGTNGTGASDWVLLLETSPLLSGTGAASSAGTGTLISVGAITGTGAATSSGSGTLTGAGTVTGTGAGASSNTGTLTGVGILGGTAAGVAAGSATMGTPALTGAGGGAAAGSGTLTGTGAETGTGAGAASATGTLAGAGAVTGTGAGAAAGTGSLTAAGAVTGTAAAASAGAGTLVGSGALVGAGAGAAAGSATLTGRGSISAEGDGAASATGSLLTANQIQGHADGAATGAGTLSGPGVLAVVAPGAAAGAGTLAGAGAMTAASSGAAGGTATLVASGVIIGHADGAATGTGALPATGSAVSGQAAGTSSGAGILVAVGRLGGAAAGRSSGRGLLYVPPVPVAPLYALPGASPSVAEVLLPSSRRS